MVKKQLAVKVSSFEETLDHFKQIWDQIEQGEEIIGAPLEIISFESAKLLMKILSPRRLDLLQLLHIRGKSTVRTLAKELARDFDNVQEDVKALHHVGLILQDSTGKYFMPWDKIVTEIPMTPTATSHSLKHKHRSPSGSHATRQH